MKTRVKLLLGLLGLLLVLVVAGWFAAPRLIKHYVNTHVLGIEVVGSVRIKSTDCLQLNDIQVFKPMVKGHLNSVTVCRKAKTIEACGGLIKYIVPNDVGEKKDSSGYKILARDIDLIVEVKGKTVFLFDAGVTTEKVCGERAAFKFGVGHGELAEACVDLKTHQVTFNGGKIYLTKVFNHEVGEVLLGAGLINPKGRSASVREVKLGPLWLKGVGVDWTEDLLVTLKVEQVSGKHSRLFPNPLAFHDVVVGPVDIHAPFDKAVQASSRGAHLTIDPARWHVEGKEDCQTWLDAVPDQLKEGPISEMKLAGVFSVDLTIKPDVRLKMSNGCRLASGPIPKFVQALRGKFEYTAYRPDGHTIFQRETGPGTADWVPLQLISPNMATALTTTEDPGFMGHRGIIPQAIENSLKDNLKLGRFFRGGSTLTMQLAKNLWLSRERTIGRKLQEAILTVALESALTKDKILELYLNVVEFGPNLYGIGPASKDILHKDPSELTLAEAMYLVLRLPAPNHSASYPQMSGLISKLMDRAVQAGKVSSDVVESEKGYIGLPANWDND